MHFIFSKPQSRTEVERLHNQIRYVSGTDEQELRKQRAKEWEEYHRRVAEHAQTARQAQPPSPQYSPTGFVPMAPWSSQSPQSMYPPQQPIYPPHVGPPPRYSTTPGGYFHSYPSPPTSNSSTNSPQSARPGFTLHYTTPPNFTGQPIHSTSGVRPPPHALPEEEPAPFRPPSRASSRSSEKRCPGRERSNSSREYREVEPERHGSQDEIPRSQCFGRNIDAGNLSLTANEQEVMAVDFEFDMTVALYRNKETNAARIVCAVDHVGSWITDQRGGGPSQGSIKVTALTIRRESKYILVLKRSKYLWARLVFSDFENMILFFSTFLALRSYSPTQDPISIGASERWLEGESSKWDGYVYYKDDTYRLHLLQDNETRAVRIAAMHHSGKHDSMTIWTVFLHEQMAGRHEWYRHEPCCVVLLRLPVYHFSTSFKPGTYPEFPLQFSDPRDATRFVEEVDDLSREF